MPCAMAYHGLHHMAKVKVIQSPPSTSSTLPRLGLSSSLPGSGRSGIIANKNIIINSVTLLHNAAKYIIVYTLVCVCVYIYVYMMYMYMYMNMIIIDNRHNRQINCICIGIGIGIGIGLELPVTPCYCINYYKLYDIDIHSNVLYTAHCTHISIHRYTGTHWGPAPAPFPFPPPPTLIPRSSQQWQQHANARALEHQSAIAQ